MADGVVERGFTMAVSYWESLEAIRGWRAASVARGLPPLPR